MRQTHAGLQHFFRVELVLKSYVGMDFAKDLGRAKDSLAAEWKRYNKSVLEEAKQGTLQERQEKSRSILEKHPDRIPVICLRDPRSDGLPEIDRSKFLVPGNLSVSQFSLVIRKRIRLPPEMAMYLTINNTMPAPTTLMSTTYDNHKDEDGFLYIVYAGENTFGS